MSDEGRAVLDDKGTQHIASGIAHYTVCGTVWAAYDLHFAMTTRYHCRSCIEWADRAKAV